MRSLRLRLLMAPVYGATLAPRFQVYWRIMWASPLTRTTLPRCKLRGPCRALKTRPSVVMKSLVMVLLWGGSGCCCAHPSGRLGGAQGPALGRLLGLLACALARGAHVLVRV